MFNSFSAKLKIVVWDYFHFLDLKDILESKENDKIKSICKPKAMAYIPQKIVKSQLRRRLLKGGV